jgi:hypothetical protein
MLIVTSWAVVTAFDRDCAASGRVLRGVVQQIREHLGEPHDVGFENDLVRRKADREVVLQRVENGLARLDGLTYHLAQRRDFFVEIHSVVVDAAHVEKVVDESHHVAELQLHHAPRPLDQRRVVFGQLQQLQAVTKRRERITQLVRERGQELVFATIHLVQGLAARFERRIQLGERGGGLARAALAFAKRHVRCAPIVHVAENRGHELPRAVVPDGGGHLEVAHRAVLEANLHFDGMRGRARRAD